MRSPAEPARRARVISAAIVVVLGGCVAHPSPSVSPVPSNGATVVDASSPSVEPIRPAGEPVVLAVTTERVTPRWGPTPNGPELLDQFGQEPVIFDPGRRIIVLGDPQPGPNGTWLSGYMVPDASGNGDFGAWFPVVQLGRRTLEPAEREGCPAAATIRTVAPLLPADRRRCLGSGDLTLEARTGFAGGYAAYDADPLWIGAGTDQRQTVSLFDAGPRRFTGGGPYSPQNTLFVDARTPPIVDVPPVGMLVRVTGHFDDAGAITCMRRVNLQIAPGQAAQPGWGVPPEAPEQSVEWCRDQFVVSAWDVVAGPEGRPIDLATPQLHRSPELPPGIFDSCAGVGMGPLVLRIDPMAIDPVWVEDPRGGRSVAEFSGAFSLVLGGPPRIVATNGVTLVDGSPVGEEAPNPGLFICTAGFVVGFDVRPGA